MARPIALKGAKRLLTLKDAGDFVQATFKLNRPLASSTDVHATIEELMQAAISDDAADIDIATAQVETLLSHEGLLEPETLRGDRAADLRALDARDAQRRKRD